MMLDTLLQVPLFAHLSEEQLQWISEHSSEVFVHADNQLYTEGSPAEHFYVLLAGELQITKYVEGLKMVLSTYQAGNFTGELPLLTGTPHIASAHIMCDSHLLVFEKEAFHQMLTICPPIVSTLLPIIAQRVQTRETLLLQREKLAALGKLAAGLAHELNNPAVAGRRAVGRLRESLQTLQSFALQPHPQLTPAQLDLLAGVLRSTMQQATLSPSLDALTESDREDELITWLDEHDIIEGWKLAATFVATGVDSKQLDLIAGCIGTTKLGYVLVGLEAFITAFMLMDEAEQSLVRISELVDAIKQYSYVGHAPQKEIDVHQGLDSTLTILGYKLKSGITILREYDQELPRIYAYGSELNQVWTNLIDNAIDAMDGQGKIWIRTAHEREHVRVEIADDGPGIPPDIQSHIFEPFFTTKDVGRGVGLGLDIVYRIVVGRHHGDIHVFSEPGNTQFHVSLPIEAYT